jgi:hypothetical protein
MAFDLINFTAVEKETFNFIKCKFFAAHGLGRGDRDKKCSSHELVALAHTLIE